LRLLHKFQGHLDLIQAVPKKILEQLLYKIPTQNGFNYSLKSDLNINVRIKIINENEIKKMANAQTLS